MKTLILYDSVYGNTAKIANAISNAIGDTATCTKVNHFTLNQLPEYDFIIVGSPTHGGMPTPALQTLLKELPEGSLHGISVAAFDTRFAPEEHGIGLRILMNVIHFAAEKIAKTLQRKGGKLIVSPEGFIVADKTGPLEKGELVRAINWASLLSAEIEKQRAARAYA